ncbi:DEAD/DEAH box helicase [Luteipulveratus halotolerans]|uniref:RNA helicase n=1 Tax=Luteipulveratus halotolerans TaxID=1631356 RepID=A0A0L6CH05_9MICO|nr:DEAD/DEAH box helicase [Luteipulveratus halotolerans]KNX37087.1 RNA helicase [Luteipulveratus halotolerans]
MPTPAERHAAARERRRFDSSHVGRFAEQYSFPLDDFQIQGCTAVQDGRGVLVAAPTGSGKTVVGEFACYLALHTGRKTFYTTPIKALSNQKYADLAARHGADNVGLLTGDSSINGEAPIVVMTTEVLRNMLYAGSSTLLTLGFVVMDEVHYLADRFRGAVWEEVIIHLPESVQVISLSATVSNAEEFGDWLREVRGDTEVIVEEHRPVPLWQHMMVGRELLDLFVDDAGGSGDDSGAKVNPELLQRISRLEASTDRHGRREDAGAPRGRRGKQVRGRRGGGPTHGGRPAGRPGGGPSRAEVIDRLDRDGLLPAITFIFSRVGCDAAVSQLLAWGTQLIPEKEGERIRRQVEERVSSLPEEDLGILGYWDFVEGLSRGFAAHHAGMLPTFREIVEELFTEGRIRAVFATETLALGINMPARTVVLERLVKFNGETHADVTPAEFTQLTGRAGRRGIDIEGHAVVLHNRGVDPHAVAGLASTRTYPLKSSFVPTSNMAVNLVDQVGRARAREVLESSFAQFQADRGVVGIARAIKRNEEALDGYADAMRCHLGDFAAYSALRREISDLEKQVRRAEASSRRAAAERSLEELQPGDVIRVAAGRRAGLAVVIQGNRGGRRTGPEPTLLTSEGQIRRLTHTDVDGPVSALTTLAIPKSFSARSPKHRRDLAATLRTKVPHDPPARGDVAEPETDAAVSDQIESLRRQLREHPCHECPYREDHARWAERWWRLRRETDGLERKVGSRTHTVSRTFDRICDLLVELGYLSEDGQQVTDQGHVLQRIYTEKDLLAAECLRTDAWKQLDPPSLAAVVSTLVHEPRRDQSDLAPRMPGDAVRDGYDALLRLWSDLEDRQRAHRLVPMGEPDAGIAWMVHRWVSGARLETVLRDSDLTAGDFVRRCKQLADLLDQIADATPSDAVRRTARKAIDGVVRGVVAADRLD